MDNKKIKPCPFCGGDVEKFIAPMMDTVVFVCHHCGADVCFYGGEHEPRASEKWNRRAEDDNKVQTDTER